MFHNVLRVERKTENGEWRTQNTSRTQPRPVLDAVPGSRHTPKVFQSRSRDLGAVKTKVFQLSQPSQVLQPSVRDLRVLKD